ncbi:MAG: hypothetical protein FWH27_01650, partial [Planctomycetaceae bacterium]|nr:hypothetical protein [Planctomycetaceae bacterium]
MMRDSFLHFLFGGKTQAGKSRQVESQRRTLNLETLEDRHMLSVSFEAPITNEYIPTSTAAVNPNLVEHRLLFSGDFNDDGKTDILAIESSRGYTYLNQWNGQNAFPDAGVLATNSLLTTMRADVGNLVGNNNLDDLLGVSITDNVIQFSVYGARGNGGFYDIPTTSSWPGLTNTLNVTVPTGGALYTGIGDIFLVKNGTNLDVVCTVAWYVYRADNSLYDFGTINLLFANDGSGKFSFSKTVSTGNMEIIAAGDLNGDSRPDYVTRNEQ